MDSFRTVFLVIPSASGNYSKCRLQKMKCIAKINASKCLNFNFHDFDNEFCVFLNGK